eukprot:6245652-Amphidinium_carterae.1
MNLVSKTIKVRIGGVWSEGTVDEVELNNVPKRPARKDTPTAFRVIIEGEALGKPLSNQPSHAAC